MMTARDFYFVISFIVPLYLAMFIGYASVKWWKLFNNEQCSGISRFCLLFAVPVLSFFYITKTDLYELNFKILGADVLQKMIVLVSLACWCNLGPGGSIEWLITIFSICTLPNTLILGVQIIRGMYHATPLVVEIFLAQSMIWHPFLLILYEYRSARIVISQQFSDTYGRNVDIKTTSTGNQGDADTNTGVEDVEAADVSCDGGGEEEDLKIHVHHKGHESIRGQTSVENEREIEEVLSTTTGEVIPETEYQRTPNCPTSISSISVILKWITVKVWKKLINNPNTYATILALIWAFVSSMFHVAMPMIVTRSITFLSNASLGMGMFNMGLSMGLCPALIPCGKVVAAFTMVLRFIIGPIVMAFASLVVGLRGTKFHIAVVQAAVSQGVVPSVYASQYNVHPEVFNIGMIYGMVVVLPVTLLYYNLLKI